MAQDHHQKLKPGTGVDVTNGLDVSIVDTIIQGWVGALAFRFYFLVSATR